MAVRLSLIVPAYNEAARLPPYLSRIGPYLDDRYGDDYEIVVVDDGGSDSLPELVREAARHWPQLRLLCHPTNRGKGAAVRTGMMASAGERLLFADADGATPIEEEAKLAAALDDGADLAVGSRVASEPGVERRRVMRRKLAGRVFALMARRALRLSVYDTQCGFKMFTRRAGLHLFRQGLERGYLFDLEILALAQRLGYRTAEVPINWSDQPGSKVRLVRDSLAMTGELWRLRRRLPPSRTAAREFSRAA
jgi:dolichyl-phosphate beta-glucosyltransferase